LGQPPRLGAGSRSRFASRTRSSARFGYTRTPSTTLDIALSRNDPGELESCRLVERSEFGLASLAAARGDPRVSRIRGASGLAIVRGPPRFPGVGLAAAERGDRKSTRLNSSHVASSY